MPRDEVIDSPLLSSDDERMPAAMVAVPGDRLAIFEMEPAELRAALDRVSQNWSVFHDWIKANLIDGTPRCYPDRPLRYSESGYDTELHAMLPNADYGCIYTKGGWSKPTLLKPGAEKICSKLLRVRASWPGVTKYEDAAVSGVAIQTVILRCLLYSGANLVGEGSGAANVEGGDINKAIKMAMKSSQIAATLSVAGISSVFTQDLDDMAEREPAPRPAPKARPDPVSARPRPAPEAVPADTAWLEEKLEFGKHKGRSWREMSEGSVDGDRHSYLQWICKQETKDQRQAITQARARVLLSGYEVQRKAEDAVKYPHSPEWDAEQPPVPESEFDR